MNSSISNEQKFLENYKKRIIKDTIKTLCNQYHIYDSGDNLLDAETLQQQILTPKIIKRCIGTTNNAPVSQCTRNAIDNYDYCKTHLYRMCLKSEEEQEFNIPIEYKAPMKNNTISIQTLKKKFIDDSFYFVDDKFIYDADNLKVGYIDNNNNNYILTSDPFVLEEI
jgi:hypothetical protein